MMEIKSVPRTVLERVGLRVTNSRDERSDRLRSIAIVPAHGALAGGRLRRHADRCARRGECASAGADRRARGA